MSIELPTPECIKTSSADSTGHHLAIPREVLVFPAPLFIEIPNHTAAITGACDQFKRARPGADSISPNQAIKACVVACFYDARDQVNTGGRKTVAIKGEHISIGRRRCLAAAYSAGFWCS